VGECRKHGVPVIADGGIKFPGDLAKAVAAGADCAMLGSLFAGTDESPGEVFLYQGRSYKYYRGMGSIGAMARGSADRYFQQEVTSTLKLVPEVVECRVPHKRPVGNIVQQLIGGGPAAAPIDILSAVETGGRRADDMAADDSRRRRYIGAKDRAPLAGHVYAVLRHRAALDWWIAKRAVATEARSRVLASLVLVEG